MSVTPALHQKFLARFDELIAEGESYRDNISETTHYMLQEDWIRNRPERIPYTQWSFDPQRFHQWKTSCLTLLGQAIPPIELLQEKIHQFNQGDADRDSISACLGILRAFRDDFAQGFLDDVSAKIAAEISANYLDQAQELLMEGGSANHSHIPAAVLAGAVLERNLRNLCNRQQPPIQTTKDSGGPLTLNPLINNLKNAGIFNDLKVKQLKAWADIRNKAAHGEYDQFDRGDVKRMVDGIADFLADYIR